MVEKAKAYLPFLRAFLLQTPEEDRSALIGHLPVREKQAMAQEHSLNTIKVKNSLLENIHWSWFLPVLKSYVPPEQSLFLKALDESTAQALAREIPCKRSHLPLQEAAQHYLRDMLIQGLMGEGESIVPVEYLLSSPLNELLKYSKEQLATFIDLLTMYDIALERRYIVSSVILRKIDAALSERERNLVVILRAKSDPLALPKLGLDQWKGSAKALRALIHRRGLLRLGMALSDQEPSLVWYVCHRLDIGRGSSLLNIYLQSKGKIARGTASRQVEELLEIL